MKRNRFISLLLCLAMVIPMLCTGASASDISVPSAVRNYLQKGDYFSIYPTDDSAGAALPYTTFSLTAERGIINQVEKGNKVQFWNIGTGKWCIQREKNGVFAIMYVENREDHKGGDDGSSPKYWALDGDHTSSGTKIHMWEDKNVNDKEKTFYLEEDNDGDPETFYICSAYAYEKKGARYVVPEDYKWVDSTVLTPVNSGVRLSNTGYSWRITIHSRATDANDNVDWMSQLDDSMPLASVNIPGTHDSCTANVEGSYAENANNYTCQQHFIDEQLNNGVRAFDIRYCKNGDKAYTCHGSGNLRCKLPQYKGGYTSVDWVMEKMTAFLKNDSNNRSRNETIIMVVKQDDGNSESPKVMAQTMLKYKDYLYDWSQKSPRLGDVRGKIVVMSRTDFSDVVAAEDLKYFGPDISDWDNQYEDNFHFAQQISREPGIFIQDDYNCTDSNKKTQVENVILQLNNQQSSTSDAKGAPTIREDDFCFNYTSKTYSDIDPNPLGAARVMNSWLTGYASKYFKNGGYRTGITMMDYCDEVLCDLIIASNAGRKHTCAFSDISESDWFHDFVEKVVELGLMNGTSETTFEPQETTNRAMLVTILYRLEGQPDVGENQFTDVAPDEWYTKAVTWAADNGIVKGYGDGKFGPMDTITREQMATILHRYSTYKDYDVTAQGDLSTFTDANEVSDWAEDAMAWAVGTELINGVGDNQLDPEGNAQRAQVAAILYRFYEKVVK